MSSTAAVYSVRVASKRGLSGSEDVGELFFFSNQKSFHLLLFFRQGVIFKPYVVVEMLLVVQRILFNSITELKRVKLEYAFCSLYYSPM